MVDPGTDAMLSLAFRLFLAFGIGALIGLEREQSESGGTFAGSRTFPLFALYGALVYEFFPADFVPALVALAIPLTVAYAGKIWIEHDIGLTTLTAALITIVLGGLTTHSEHGAVLAVVIGGVVTTLLSAKGRIHHLADRIDEAERRATIKFVLVAFVILPLLPDRKLDSLLGLNPRFVWLMVVFVSGLSFVAYVLSRVLGAERGLALTGVLGGFVSSTATTVAMANRSTESPGLYQVCAYSTVIAAIVMFPRALIEIAVINPGLLPTVMLPLGGMTIVGVVTAGVVYWRTSADPDIDADVSNPFRLRPALFFGVLFAVVLLLSEYANQWLGASGIYATAFISGLADVDAITLSLSKLSAEGSVASDVATTGIVTAAIANTAMKAGLAWILGSPQLGKLVTIMLGTVSAVGIALVLLL